MTTLRRSSSDEVLGRRPAKYTRECIPKLPKGSLLRPICHPELVCVTLSLSKGVVIPSVAKRSRGTSVPSPSP